VGVTNTNQLPPGVAINLDSRRKRLIAFWNSLDLSELGGTLREVLELRDEVNSFIEHGLPGDLRQAELLTSKAMAIIAFQRD
jgi:hypothetical protein